MWTERRGRMAAGLDCTLGGVRGGRDDGGEGGRVEVEGEEMEEQKDEERRRGGKS